MVISCSTVLNVALLEQVLSFPHDLIAKIMHASMEGASVPAACLCFLVAQVVWPG